MAQPGALEAAVPAGGGRRSSARTTGSCARSPARRRTCARSCSSRSSGSRRCSSSSACSGCASSARRTPASRGSARSSSGRRPTDELQTQASMLRQLLGVPHRRRSGRCHADRREELVRRAALGARRRGDPVRPVAARAVDERGDLRLRAAAGRRADARSGSGSTTTRFDDAMTARRRRSTTPVSPAAGRARRSPPRSTPTTTSSRARTISPSGRPTRPRP